MLSFLCQFGSVAALLSCVILWSSTGSEPEKDSGSVSQQHDWYDCTHHHQQHLESTRHVDVYSATKSVTYITSCCSKSFLPLHGWMTFSFEIRRHSSTCDSVCSVHICVSVCVHQAFLHLLFYLFELREPRALPQFLLCCVTAGFSPAHDTG